MVDDGSVVKTVLPVQCGIPSCRNHPIVAVGTISVKGKISSKKLTYFKISPERPWSYMATIAAAVSVYLDVASRIRTDTDELDGGPGNVGDLTDHGQQVRGTPDPINHQAQDKFGPNVIGDNHSGQRHRRGTGTRLINHLLTRLCGKDRVQQGRKETTKLLSTVLAARVNETRKQ